MKILLIGSGGRESAIAWKLSKSEKVTEIYCAPGNAGTACYGKNIPIAESEIEKLIEFTQEQEIDLTIVGPEKPLADGIVDRFISHGLTIFGPTQSAAMLEGSKVFSKQFMSEHNIPTAPYHICATRSEVHEITSGKSFPYVIKVDGLAAGKGALVINNEEDLRKALEDIFDSRIFGEAGNRVVVEDFLEGEELSVFAITDGTDYVLLPAAQDHKRAYDGDKGPNTGGMGAYAPAPLGSAAVLRKVEEQIIRPVLEGMKERGTPYSGVLYCGLMIHESFQLSDEYAACIILASGGYPGNYEKGKIISGIDSVFRSQKAHLFLAGTTYDGQNYLSNGGRVLGITVVSKNLNDAIFSAYNYANIIQFEGKHFRTDIGYRVLKKFRSRSQKP